jgi:hypothetical protein
MVKRNKIIYHPNKISKYRHGLEFFIKLFLSAAVFFLTLSLWGYYGSYFYQRLFSESYFANTADILGKLFIVALFAFVAMFSWQQYNILAFGGRTRRRGIPPFPDSVLADRFHMKAEDVGQLRQAKHIWIERKYGAQTVWHTDTGIDISGFFIGDEPPQEGR